MGFRRVWLRSGKSANDDMGTVANKLIGRGSHRWRIGAKHITPAALVAAAVAIAICTWLLAPPLAEVQAQVLVGPTVSRVTPSAYRLSLARGTTQQFRVRATAGDRSISSWEWTLDGVSQGGQSLALTQSIERTFSHTFSTAGNYTVRASFTDTDGRRGANSWEVRVYNPATPDSPRIVSMGCSPTVVRVEQVVSCRPSLSGGTPTEYRWGAIGGDPWAGTGQNFSTRWSSAGSKRVVLEVCNTGGCDTEEQYINVHLCFQHLGELPGGRTDLSGSWNGACASTHRNGRYGRFYAFTLSERTEVQIDLASSQDTVLYLLNGANSRGTIVTSDDGGGSGNNSRITTVLEAGTYTAEATTYNSRVTGDFTLSIYASAAPRNCFQHLGELPGGRTDLSGSWNGACASTHRNGRYGRFYAFTLSERTEVQIDLASSQDTVLYLLNGANSRGTIVTSDDGGGSGNNSRITTVLEAGTYTAEATTYNSRVTGDFTLSIYASAAPRNCFQHLGELPGGRTDLSGSWNGACASTHRNGRYGRFYAFTLSERTEVQIDLASSQDTVLYLLNGANSRGTIVTSDDGGGSGNNSRITTVLEAGTYTAEATTYNSRVTGDFTLSIYASAAPRNCFQHLGELPGGRTDLSGSWNGACASTHRNGRYGRFYAFTLSERTEVQIDLASSQDTVLYLLNGAGSTGAVVDVNDDVSRGNTDSRITTVLEAGTYTVEATTIQAGVTGNFTLTITPIAVTSRCNQDLGTLPQSANLPGEWTGACASVQRSGSYGRFYTFELTQRGEVQIDLISTRNAYLYLLSGAGAGGPLVASDNDGGSGNNSRITAVLEAGTYTVEATTFNPGTIGTFDLRITSRPAPMDPCTDTLIASDSSVDTAPIVGEWTSDCSSEHRSGSYARYYTFTLASPSEMTITLESGFDTFLYLLEGAGTSGTVIASNNDVASDDTDSQLREFLSVGTYTIEATTYKGAVTGDFTLTVTAITVSQPPFEAPRNVLGVSNSPGELTLSWGSADNPDSYLLIAVNMDTFEYETVIVSDGAARMGTVSGLTSGGSYLGIVVALKVTGGVVETPYGVATRVTVR